MALNFSDLFTISFSFNSSLFTTNFSLFSTFTQGILGVCYNYAIGYLLKIFGCHFPCIDFTDPNTLVPLALKELRPNWSLKPSKFYNTSYGDMLLTGTVFLYPLIYDPEMYGWLFLLQMKSILICGLLLMNSFILGDNRRDLTPVELPP